MGIFGAQIGKSLGKVGGNIAGGLVGGAQEELAQICYVLWFTVKHISTMSPIVIVSTHKYNL